MICSNCGNHIFLTDEDNLPDVWSHLEETNCDDPDPTSPDVEKLFIHIVRPYEND